MQYGNKSRSGSLTPRSRNSSLTIRSSVANSAVDSVMNSMMNSMGERFTSPDLTKTDSFEGKDKDDVDNDGYYDSREREVMRQ